MWLRILLVDDHDLVRMGLKALLSHHPQFTVVAEAASASEALAQMAKYPIDVVVMDIRLPGRSGIEATREIVQQYPATRVIMLTSYADDETLFEAIAAGAVGYVLKQIGGNELVRALETIGSGESLIDSALTQRVFERVRDDSRKTEHEAFTQLSSQELRILARVAAGESNKVIAAHIYLSEKTVRNYVSSILDKLNLLTRAAAAAYAEKHHLEDHLPNA